MTQKVTDIAWARGSATLMCPASAASKDSIRWNLGESCSVSRSRIGSRAMSEPAIALFCVSDFRQV
jgi:hypothetical protein